MAPVPEREREGETAKQTERDSWTVMASNLQRFQDLLLHRRVKPNKIYAPVASNAKDISDKERKMLKGRETESKKKGAVWKRELFQFRRQTTICAQKWRQFCRLAAFLGRVWSGLVLACPTLWNFHL